MARLLFITDYTEQFSYRLLHGILDYSREGEKWVVFRMPSAYKKIYGIDGVLKWALNWKADVVVGQFYPDEDISQFRKNGIVVIAQDYISKFSEIPNITADYRQTGIMAAEHFLTKGFRNFAFFGYSGICWSQGRFDGFKEKIEKAGYSDRLYLYDKQYLDDICNYDLKDLIGWIQSLPKPVGIMACDDNQGNILLNACNSCGIKIPEAVAVLGVDNDEIIDNLSDPTLSSIDVDIEQGGYNLAKMVMNMLTDSSYKGENIILHPVSVIARASTSIFATCDKEIVKAIQFIHENLDRNISVSDILKEVPLSRRLLEIRFKKITGNTIYNYISRLRVERFAYLLLRSNETITEIAAKMNEDVPNSLCRRFKKLKGCTPTEYRKIK